MLLPYKILALLLYSNVPGIYRLGDRHYLVETAKLAELLKTNSTRLREYFATMLEWGLLDFLSLEHGKIRCHVKQPVKANPSME